MSTEQWIALAAVAVAVVALVSTVLLAAALRRVRAQVDRLGESTPQTPATAYEEPHTTTPAVVSDAYVTRLPAETDPALTPTEPVTSAGEGDIVTRDGRVVVIPTTEQVVEATMGRPMIRGAVLAYGIRYALRPESRDRLRGMMRREYRRRRRLRLRAGRRAARRVNIPPAQAQSWLGTTTRNRLNGDDIGGS